MDYLNCPIADLEGLVQQARSAYYNGQTDLADTDYDQLEEILRARCPTSEILKQVGAEVQFDPRKTDLPCYMSSMDKLYPNTSKLERWLTKHQADPNYCISHKLDGLSGLFCLGNASQKLYTRGSGTIGLDVSHFIEHITSLNQIKYHQRLIVRGELIISKNKWHSTTVEAKNPRNMVSGIINSKHPTQTEIQLIDFVAYQVVYPDNLKPNEQFELMQSIGFLVAPFQVMTLVGEVQDNLIKILNQARAEGLYQIDGIILSHNSVYPPVLEKLPIHSIAFKQNPEQGKLTTVRAVQWAISRWGALKPTLLIEPVEIVDTEGGSVTVQKVTAYNAKYILDNKIGTGSQIRIVRSGGVIPTITQIVTETEASMPDMENTVWNETGIDLLLKKPTNDSNVVSEGLVYFFKTMETKYVSDATVAKMTAAGFNTVARILRMTREDLMKLPGFGIKSVENVYQSLSGVLVDVDESHLMAASGCFGFGMGRRKMRAILDVYPDFASWGDLNWNVPNRFESPCATVLQNPRFKDLVGLVIKVAGFQYKSAQKVVYNLPTYQRFLAELQQVREIHYKNLDIMADFNPLDNTKHLDETKLAGESNLEIDPKTTGEINIELEQKPPSPTVALPIHKNLWTDEYVVFSGFRDTELEQQITISGGKVQTTVNQKTTILLVKEDTNTTKVQKARELGIEIRKI